MKKTLWSLLKRGGKTAPEEQTGRKVQATVNTDFVKGIIFEEDPFKGEIPTETKIYDLEGNEVKP